jgi:hypothetical protein
VTSDDNDEINALTSPHDSLIVLFISAVNFKAQGSSGGNLELLTEILLEGFFPNRRKQSV